MSVGCGGDVLVANDRILLWIWVKAAAASAR